MFTASVRKKSIDKKKPMRLLAVILIPVVAFIIGAAVPGAWAKKEPLEFEETKFNIEFNFSDEDLGVRAFVDGEPISKITIKGPKNSNGKNTRPIFFLRTKRGVRHQGIAELFFESGEPTLDEVSVQEFLARFPEGTYKFKGTTIEKDKIEGEAEFTHVIPCGPANLSAIGNPIVIGWDFVTQVVDLDNTTSGTVLCIEPADPADLEIVGYRVEVEWEDVEEVAHIFSIDLEADQNSVTVPPEFIPAGQDYKYEVLAIEASGNQTITEEEVVVP